MTNTTIEQQVREQVAAFLLGAIDRALVSYFQFSKDKPTDKECKEFAARHAAAKAAISHVELLIKLARWADLPDPAAENHNQQIVLAAMLQEAQEEVDSYNAISD